MPKTDSQKAAWHPACPRLSDPTPAPGSRHPRAERPRTRLLPVLWVALVPGFSGLRAQEPAAEPEPPKLSTLVRAFRKAETAEERRTLGRALFGRGEEGRSELLETAGKELESRSRELQKGLAKHRRRFETMARKLVLSRLDRRARSRIDTLRDEVRTFRRGDLTKAVVQTEIDPRVVELRSILWLSTEEVFTAEEDLRAEFDELQSILRDLIVLDELGRAVLAEDRADDPQVGHSQAVEAGRRALETVHPDSVLRAIPASGSDRSALDHNDSLRGEIDPEELDGIVALNELRLLLGLGALKIDPKLCDASRDHSKDMAELGFFAHESPVEGKRRFSDRAANFGTSASAENIARGQRTGRGAIRGWWYSPGHHKNMMRQAGRVGLGHHASHWTQLFGS